jgi:predicted small lipoprotein YifL
MTRMRHRLFHAVVLAALPGCGSNTPPVAPDVTKDAGVTVQETAPANDTGTPAVDASVETGPDAKCYCAEGCLPCIK